MPNTDAVPVEQVVVVLVPAEAVTGDEALGDVVLGEHGRARRLEHAALVDGAVLVGQHRGVLGRQAVGLGLGVVLDIAAGALAGQPLAHVALVGAGALGQLGGRDGLAVGHRLVEAETEADHAQRHVHGRGDLVDDAVDEGLYAALVDGDVEIRACDDGKAAGAPVPEGS